MYYYSKHDDYTWFTDIKGCYNDYFFKNIYYNNTFYFFKKIFLIPTHQNKKKNSKQKNLKFYKILFEM